MTDKKLLKKFKEKSKLTKANTMKLGKEVSKAVSSRLRKQAN